MSDDDLLTVPEIIAATGRTRAVVARWCITRLRPAGRKTARNGARRPAYRWGDVRACLGGERAGELAGVAVYEDDGESD